MSTSLKYSIPHKKTLKGGYTEFSCLTRMLGDPDSNNNWILTWDDHNKLMEGWAASGNHTAEIIHELLQEHGSIMITAYH